MAEKKTVHRGYVHTLWERYQEGAEDVMKMWKAGAKRPDRIGDASYYSLELLHRGTGVAVRTLTRLERATVPPARAKHPVHVHPTPAEKPPERHTAERHTAKTATAS